VQFIEIKMYHGSDAHEYIVKHNSDDVSSPKGEGSDVHRLLLFFNSLRLLKRCRHLRITMVFIEYYVILQKRYNVFTREVVL